MLGIGACRVGSGEIDIQALPMVLMTGIEVFRRLRELPETFLRGMNGRAAARAFLEDAPVLILDEATSHLDAVGELVVHRALEDLMAQRTTVVIAHRLSTVRDADRIVVLNEGRVVETGTHGELLARGGLYAHLVARQMGAVASTAAQ